MDNIWPQVIVALGLFALMGTITVVAMFKHPDQPEQVLRIWNAQVGLLGAVVGMIATYFFTQASIGEARQAREFVHSIATEQREYANQATKESVRLMDQLDRAQLQLRDLHLESMGKSGNSKATSRPMDEHGP